MPRAETVQSFKKEPEDAESRIISAIGKVGPRNIAAIARMTGVHQETVRYKIKKRFGALGFRFHADVDYGKLGLTLHWGTLHFGRSHYANAPKLLDAMNQSGYLTYYARILPQGHYVALFALPEGTSAGFSGVLNGLRDKGVLTGFSLDEVVAYRHATMDPRHFNFKSRTWAVEWERVKGERGTELPLEKKQPSILCDEYDLLIIKELQKDALQHVVGMAHKLKVHEKTLEYHYRTHVMKNKLVRAYIVRWTRDIEKSLAHSVATTRLTFRGLGRSDFESIQKVVSKIPFLWAEELLRDGTYIATAYTPLTEMLGMFGYLNDEISDLDSKVEVGFVKPHGAYLYTIPHHMFSNDGWKFNPKRMLSGIEKSA